MLHYDGTPITARFITRGDFHARMPGRSPLGRERSMTYIAKPKLHHPTLAKNKVGYTRRDYEGKISTLCAGCGHDSISAAIVQACWELDIEPHRVAKLSGIGCSSKTPDYFLGNSHGFNSVHGRMPSVLTGANLANRELIYMGVSGDGDSASIGIGQFVHAMRRGVNMVYIVENNGVYGLTKGQFSATADKGSKSKRGIVNSDEPLDMIGMALLLGATYVARSFSGDKKQLVPLIKGAIEHKGAAFIDVISPCVAFNNHAGSTKSYEYVRQHNEAVTFLDFIDLAPELHADAMRWRRRAGPRSSSTRTAMAGGTRRGAQRAGRSHQGQTDRCRPLRRRPGTGRFSLGIVAGLSRCHHPAQSGLASAGDRAGGVLRIAGQRKGEILSRASRRAEWTSIATASPGWRWRAGTWPASTGVK